MSNGSIDPKYLIEKGFQKLINEKHLYQSAEIDFEWSIETRAESLFGAQGLEGRTALEDIRTNELSRILQKHWVLDWPKVGHVGPYPPTEIRFSLPPLK